MSESSTPRAPSLLASNICIAYAYIGRSQGRWLAVLVLARCGSFPAHPTQGCWCARAVTRRATHAEPRTAYEPQSRIVQNEFGVANSGPLSRGDLEGFDQVVRCIFGQRLTVRRTDPAAHVVVAQIGMGRCRVSTIIHDRWTRLVERDALTVPVLIRAVEEQR